MNTLTTKTKILLVVLLLALIVAVVWYVSSTRWTRDFDIKYVGYVGESEKGNYSGSSYDIYEITNNTNRTLRDVRVVIKIEDAISEKSWKFEDKVVSSIKPGETVVYKLYRKDCEKASAELGKNPLFFDDEIVRIKYSR